jgi:hypothetical protein
MRKEKKMVSKIRVTKSKDFIGQDISVGTRVIFMRVGHRDFTTGVIISMGEKAGTIELDDGYGTARQLYKQMIRANHG